MTKENKTQETDSPVMDFINLLDDEQTINDCLKLIEIMSEVSGHKPKMWGSSIVGFDSCHYKYESGREGDSLVIGFSPRKGKITVYAGATDQHPELFAKLGKHTTGKSCIYFKRLCDIDSSMLTQILKESYSYTKSLGEVE